MACLRKRFRIKLLHKVGQQPPKHAAGEKLQRIADGFNRSLYDESRAVRRTGDGGVVVLREILGRSGIIEWMVLQPTDSRRQKDVFQDLASLIRTSVLLAEQAWRDHDDADALRDDRDLRLAASSASGCTPLDRAHGLALQPTLWRFTAIMDKPTNRSVLRKPGLELEAWPARGARLCSVTACRWRLNSARVGAALSASARRKSSRRAGV